MIADGITASNEGRGYVLRRLIRRVVRYGRLLGIDREFTAQVAETAIALSESAYPTVRAMERSIKLSLQREEVNFLKTLDRGENLLAEMLQHIGAGGQIPGADVFKLYDTFGFPMELTEEIAAEQDITIDQAGFTAEMEKQRLRSQQAHETIDLTAQGTLDQLADHIEQTQFLGYTQPTAQAVIQVLMVNGKNVPLAGTGTEVQIVLDQTPFYAESGGQVGDRGYFSGEELLIRVTDVKKESAFFVHHSRVERGTVQVGDVITAQIDLACRRRAQAHHTATHLLQSALKRLVDDNISQAGSLVSFDRLRFDFHCPRALTSEEVQQVEAQVNTWVTEAHPAHTETMAIAEAKAKGAIAMFGEKYGSEVRVLDVAGVSLELCGGTHVSNTAEIGVFKIIAETGVAAGIRRIEAIAGAAVLEYLNLRDAVVKDLSDRFKVKPEEITDRITSLQAELKATQKQLEVVKGQLALAQADTLLSQAEAIGEFNILVAQLEGVDPESLKTAAEQLQQKLTNGAVVLGSVPEPDKVSLVAAFSPAVNQKGLQAGKLVGAIAKLCGGGGGGRPNLAQAGGRDASQLPAALAAARQQLQSGLQA
jgi:alanyl-tRNA synthetase